MKPSVDPVKSALPLLAASRYAPVRLAVDLTELRPGGENGGVKPFIFEYIRALGEREGAKLIFLFLTWSRSHAEVRQLARPGDHLICVREEPGTDRSSLIQWRSAETVHQPTPPDLLIQLRADLLYAPLGSVALSCPGVPTIATIVDLLHRDYPATLPHGEIAARETYFAELTTRAEQFQCISQYTADRLHFHYGTPAKRTFCNHIVIHERLQPTTEASPAPADRPYFLFPANAWEHKNHLTLLVAYRRYCQRLGERAWNLVLTGHDSPAMQFVLEAATTLGLRDRVHYFGHLPNAPFAALWQRARALVFPSLHEGFGIPILEAMHFGIPILCSSEGSLPEVAGDAAMLVDTKQPLELASALERLTRDDFLQQSLRAAGKRRLAHFDLEKEIDTFARRIHQQLGRAEIIWKRGLHVDGWMEQKSVFALPAAGEPRRLVVQIAPLPAARRFRLYHRALPLGGFSVPAGEPFTAEVAIGPGSGPLVIECPDAGNLNPADPRLHGVIVQAVTVHTATAVSQLL